VTIVTKTFLRYTELQVLISSIRTYYKDIKIIIADDSLEPQKVNGSNIEQYIMPPAQVQAGFGQIENLKVDIQRELMMDIKCMCD
jgi:hypothetical protein